jgi:hypothetical protein
LNIDAEAPNSGHIGQHSRNIMPRFQNPPAKTQRDVQRPSSCRVSGARPKPQPNLHALLSESPLSKLDFDLEGVRSKCREPFADW